LAAAQVSGMLSSGAVVQDCPVNNFYGQGVPTSSDVVCEIGITIESRDVPDGFKEAAMWKGLKRNPKEIPLGIAGTAPDGTEFAEFDNCKINTQTCELIVEGKSMGVMRTNPVDVIIDALESDMRISIPEVIEKSVWEFVNDNIDKFNWRAK